MGEDYPGDASVDWVGASVQLRTSSTGPSYAASFAKTVTALGAVTDEPIPLAETAAAQTDLGVDRTDLKGGLDRERPRPLRVGQAGSGSCASTTWQPP